MPNALTITGLTTATRAELIAYWYARYLTIYGVDLSLADPSDPDVLIVNEQVQATLDLEDLVTQVFDSFDPDQAFGTTLDQRLSINGIKRQNGTPTIQNLTVVVDRALSLPGSDLSKSPFTYADAQGNQWQLLNTQTPSLPGTYVYAFQSAKLGPIVSPLNTINVPVTVVLGVVSVNNPTPAAVLGISFEQDSAAKIRRQQSVAIPSSGYFNGLLAAVKNVPGMVSAFVYENDTDGVVNGIPGHTIWVITDGTALPADIAQAIYTHRSAGCGMKGVQTYIVTQADLSPFLIQWDNVVNIPLFTKFTVASFDGVNPPNIANLLAKIPAQFIPGVGASVNVNELVAAIQNIDPNTYATLTGFSLSAGGAYTPILTPAALNDKFLLAAGTTIIIPIMLTSPNSIISVVLGVVQTALTINTNATEQFAALGGYTVSSWVLFGPGTLSPTGLYTAPAFSGTATIQYTDTLGNIGTAAVTIV